jgi:hypothetical protein
LSAHSRDRLLFLVAQPALTGPVTNMDDEFDPELIAERSSIKFLKIGIPVMIVLLTDAFLVRLIERKQGNVVLHRRLSETFSNDNRGVDAKTSIYLALGFLGMIILVTGLLLFLYMCGCVKIILAWMVMAVSAIFSNYVSQCLSDVVKILNIPVDNISVGFLIWNLVVVGNMAIFWRAPQIITQCFLMMISVLISTVFLAMPDWSVWTLLALLVAYDACVVLCPLGFLNILIKESEQRGDAIPALVYSSAVFFLGVDDSDNAEPEMHLDGLESDNESNSEERSAEATEEEDDKGVRLGLGDFCFYGILVTRAARLGWDLAIICILAINLGLTLTLIFLAIFKRPLPALPLSLVLGTLFFMIGAVSFRAYSTELRIHGLVL